MIVAAVVHIHPAAAATIAAVAAVAVARRARRTRQPAAVDNGYAEGYLACWQDQRRTRPGSDVAG